MVKYIFFESGLLGRCYHMLVCKLFIWRNLLFGNTFSQLNAKLFNIKINDRKVMITFVATVLLGKFSKDVLTALIPSDFGILVYKALQSRDTKCELSGILSVVLIFCKRSLVSCI